MNFTAGDVKKLREETGAGFNDCRNALAENDSFEAAIKYLEEKGKKNAEKVKGQDRETLQGTIYSYIHNAVRPGSGGTLGVIVEINCSTDFVARGDDFQLLAKEIALQIAGFNPEYISYDDIPAEVIEAERQRIASDPDVQAKPERVRGQIIDGKLKKEFSPKILLEQPWLKDETKTIGTLIDEVIQKTREKITVRRFVRYQLGEQLATQATIEAENAATVTAPAEVDASAKIEPAKPASAQTTKSKTGKSTTTKATAKGKQ
jgi:elongation factor Ts